jgi:hypothetical protein
MRKPRVHVGKTVAQDTFAKSAFATAESTQSSAAVMLELATDIAARRADVI